MKGTSTVKRNSWTSGFLLALVLVAAIPGYSQNPARTYWPTNGWRTVTPESQGIDSSKLADALDYIHSRDVRIHSLLVVRNGYIVLDVSFFPYDGKTLHDVASVTKSVTSTLIGSAINESKIKSVRQPVVDLFSKAPIANDDARKRKLNIEHLLTMSSGIQCQPREN